MLQWMISSFSPVTLNWQLSSSGFQSIILNRSWFGSKMDSKNFNSAFSPETDIFHSSQARPRGEGKLGRNATAQLVYGSRTLAWEQQQRAGWVACYNVSDCGFRCCHDNHEHYMLGLIDGRRNIHPTVHHLPSHFILPYWHSAILSDKLKWTK